MPSPVLVPNWCREGRRGRDGKMDGALSVINADRRESVLVSGKYNRHGLAQAHQLCGWQWEERR